ncbi:MAG: DNA N-6-adenine-methyltransferase [Pseudomonadota bacterium]
MAEHENSIGESDDWYTPPEIFEALGIQFELDPCSPGVGHWVPATHVYTRDDDGLVQPWSGSVFMNPPFGGRNGHVPWLRKFFDHGDGVCIVRAYTSSDWWHENMHRAHGILFPKGKTKFIPSPSLRMDLDARAKAAGRTEWRSAPGHGVVLVGMGFECCAALENSKLGMYWNRSRDLIAA